jgi:pimeloyl-ACP methyl ester carboxylesterase
VDVNLHVVERGSGNPVVLLHGFPELAFSWRRQIAALADAGYRVLAPDMRGYGQSDAPEPIEAYNLLELCGDVARLLDERDIARAAIVGHDWGATVAWQFALSYPERTACVAGISVPLIPRAPVRPLQIMRKHLGDDFYVVWFQEPGVAEEALSRDVRRTVLTTKVWTEEWAAADEDVMLPRG